MTEAEWNTCARPYPMLVFLRGELNDEQKQVISERVISPEGILYAGDGQWITGEQCRRFILRCSSRLLDLPLREPDREALDAYRRYVVDGAPRRLFGEACLRIQEARLSGGSTLISHLAEYMWTDDPGGAACAISDFSVSVAYEKARESVAVTCADATEDDWFNWCFSSGPPDPHWRSARAEEERFQADVLREIVRYPFQMDT